MKTECVQELVARIQDALAREPDGVLAFDADGTIWSGDIGDDFFFAFVKNADFHPSATRAMREIAADFALEKEGEGAALAHRIWQGYEAGHVSEERLYEMMAWVCAGWSRHAISAFAREALSRAQLSERLHREVVSVLEWAQAARVLCVVVSASPRPVLDEAFALLSISVGHVVAVTPVFEGDTALPAVERPIPYGPGKVTGLRARIGRRPLCAAFGDNEFDFEMLRAARIGVMVRPKPRLLARAAKAGSLVQLEPLDGP